MSWCWAPIWSPWPNFCFLSDSCKFLDVGRPLWQEDGSVIYSYNCFWSLPEQSLSGPSPTELTTIFYCLIWDSPNLEGQVPVFISPRNRVPQLCPRALGSLLVTFYYSQGYGGGIPTHLHTELIWSWNKLRLTVSRSVCPVVRHPSETRYQYFFLLEIFFKKIAGLLFCSSLSDERTVIYCCCWFSPAQTRSGLSPAGLKTIFYFPNSWDSPTL
jgi:hypothetical protein